MAAGKYESRIEQQTKKFLEQGNNENTEDAASIITANTTTKATAETETEKKKNTKRSSSTKDRNNKATSIQNKNQNTTNQLIEASLQETPPVEEPKIKKGGAPKKRKEGDRKMNFFLDEDLAAGIDYMTYGTTFTKYVNKLIRADMNKHLAARKELVDQLDD